MISDLIYIIILSIIEGITEWLPISSTAHLILADELLIGLNVNPSVINEEFKMLFDVLVQFGAILAVVVVFPKKFNPLKNINLWIKIFISIIPIVIVAVVFDDLIYNYFYNVTSISIVLIIYGVIFILVSIKKEGIKKEVSYKDAFYIGVIQTLSVIPATSRSGVTLSGLSLMGYNLTESTRYSFLLAVPIIFGATVFKSFKYFLINSLSLKQVILLFIGMSIAFLISLFVIKKLMALIKKSGLMLFGIYRIILGMIILIFRRG